MVLICYTEYQIKEVERLSSTQSPYEIPPNIDSNATVLNQKNIKLFKNEQKEIKGARVELFFKHYSLYKNPRLKIKSNMAPFFLNLVIFQVSYFSGMICLNLFIFNNMWSILFFQLPFLGQKFFQKFLDSPKLQTSIFALKSNPTYLAC